jgi:hypothetical protein
MLASIKAESLSMLFNDPTLLERQVAAMSPATKAALRVCPVSLRDPAKPKVRAAPSDIHGRGLFADEDISKGDFLTFFPVDVSFYFADDGPRACYAAHLQVHTLDSAAQCDMLVNNRMYAHVVTDEGMPLMMALPLESASSERVLYLGHLANDGACPPETMSPTEIMQYEDASYAARNAAQLTAGDGIFVMTVATRDIAKGEEVLVTYGKSWWRAYHVHTMQQRDTKTHIRTPPIAGDAAGKPMNFSQSALETAVVGAADVVLPTLAEGDVKTKMKAAQNYASSMLSGSDVLKVRKYLDNHPELVGALQRHDKDAVMVFAEGEKADDGGLVAGIIALLRETPEGSVKRVFEEIDVLWEEEE